MKRLLVAGLAVLFLAVALFAWQQDGSGDGPLNAVAAAAERTQEEPGGRATMRAIVSMGEPPKSFPMRGEIVFDDDVDRSRGVITFPNPKADGLVEMEVVMDGTVMYMRSNTFDKLPDETEWMKIDLSAAAGIEPPVPAAGDTEKELAILEATGDIQKLGQKRVRGVPTTHYQGTVETSERVEELREEGQEGLASLVEKESGPVDVEAWIDTDGLVRRIKMVRSQSSQEAGDGPTTMDMRMDFFDFGGVSAIEVPDEDDVFDATPLIEEELERRSGA